MDIEIGYKLQKCANLLIKLYYLGCINYLRIVLHSFPFDYCCNVYKSLFCSLLLVLGEVLYTCSKEIRTFVSIEEHSNKL
jgi:hypothetical protein